MLNLIRAYLPEYRYYSIQLVIAFVAMVIVAAANAAIAWMAKPLLDEIFVERNITLLYRLPLYIILAYLAKGSGSFAQEYAMGFIGQDIVRKVRDRLLKHILYLDLAFFYQRHSGELISRITGDISRIQGAVSTNLATIFREGLTALTLIAVVIYQSPTLSFLTLVVIPAAFYPITLIARRLKHISHTAQERTALLTTSLSEMLNNIEAIKAYHTEDFETERFSCVNQSCLEINLNAIKMGSLVIPVLELFASFSAATLIILGGHQVINGNLSIGGFFSFMTALLMAVDPIRRFSQTYAQFQDAVAAHSRIQEILEFQPEIIGEDIQLGDIQQIDFLHASLRYANKTVLQDINLSCRKGEVIALVGKSGAGKSSIANLLLRFFDVATGEVLINGQNIRRYSLSSIRSRIALVSQRVHIFHDTIAANVAYGNIIYPKQVIVALQKANIWEYVQTLAEGINTVLAEAGTNLSGGQRQRIAIARALYRAPSVLILDEATSALDQSSEAAIIETIQKLAPDILTIIIAHRLRSVEIADRIYFLDDGLVVCHGTKTELIHSCAAFQELYR